MKIFNLAKPPLISWYNSDPQLSNKYCLYCSGIVGSSNPIEPSNLEHLIGRNFVPKGTLGRSDAFNFLFRACKKCNLEKAKAESHISALTLMLGSGRRTDQRAGEAAQIKESAVWEPSSPGTPIRDFQHSLKISAKLGNADIQFNLQSNAQHQEDFVLLLAYRQIQAFFSMITSSDPRTDQGTRLLPTDHFHFYDAYHDSDWGHPHALVLGERVAEINWHVDVVTAEGFYRARLGKFNQTDPWWFWALEWNKQLRVCGWIGDTERPAIFKELPEEYTHSPIMQPDGSSIRARLEVSLKRGMPCMFDTL